MDCTRFYVEAFVLGGAFGVLLTLGGLGLLAAWVATWAHRSVKRALGG